MPMIATIVGCTVLLSSTVTRTGPIVRYGHITIAFCFLKNLSNDGQLCVQPKELTVDSLSLMSWIMLSCTVLSLVGT